MITRALAVAKDIIFGCACTPPIKNICSPLRAARMHISNALKVRSKALSYELERSKVTERQSEASHRDHEVSGSTASVEWAHAGALSCSYLVHKFEKGQCREPDVKNRKTEVQPTCNHT